MLATTGIVWVVVVTFAHLEQLYTLFSPSVETADDAIEKVYCVPGSSPVIV